MSGVKYSIYLKGKEIHSVQDIRNNFQIYELIDLMNSGRLRNWLEMKGENVLADRLSIWSSVDKTLRKQLLYDVFEMPYDEATAYNITDQLLEEKAKNNRDFENGLNYHVEYSNECFKKDLEYIIDDAEDSDDQVIVYLRNGFDSYDIPFENENIHYIGYCSSDSIYLPCVNLRYSPEKYSERNITFENVTIHLKHPSGIDKRMFKYLYDKWQEEHHSKSVDDFMDYLTEKYGDKEITI